MEPDAWQLDVLRAFADPARKRIGMKAAKGCGKTALLAGIAWQFLATRMDPAILATSISADNLRDGLWTEMARWQSRSDFLRSAFTWGKERITANCAPDKWWMAARSWSASADRSKQADTLAGFHAENALFILDEVGGIPDAVMAAAEAALATGAETRIVMAGNPTQLSGPLYRAATTERNLWFLAEITGDPDDPKRSSRISVQWARDQIAKWGADNPWVLVNVFGRFPPSSLDVLLGPEEVRAAMGRPLREEDFNREATILGVDVARYGDARTVITRRQGRATWEPIILRNADSFKIAAVIARQCFEHHIDAIMIDDTGGWAVGAIDALRLAGIAVIPVNASGSATDVRYFNKRAECHFLAAEWVKGGGSLFPLDDYARELTAPTYTYNKNKFQLESKDQISDRLGYSPDVADALSLTFAQVIFRGTRLGAQLDPVAVAAPQGNVVHEFDPYA